VWSQLSRTWFGFGLGFAFGFDSGSGQGSGRVVAAPPHRLERRLSSQRAPARRGARRERRARQDGAAVAKVEHDELLPPVEGAEDCGARAVRLPLCYLEEGIVHRPQHARQHAGHAFVAAFSLGLTTLLAPLDTPVAATGTPGSHRTSRLRLGAGSDPRTTGEGRVAGQLRRHCLRGELCSLDAAVAVPNAVEAVRGGGGGGR
jgi:hypothetical protein